MSTIRTFNEILFYDGYGVLETKPVPPGVIRLRNDLYTRKLTTAELQSIGTTLTANVTIKPSCDNYDRIGNVNFALVPKGADSYKVDDPNVKRFEVGRFITPFMNKNRMPDSVPYSFVINEVAEVLRSTGVLADYDVWSELQLFGVPYAANNEVAGCAGRNDVFFGTLDLVTNGPAQPKDTFFLPLRIMSSFNNYKDTDVSGKTVRIIKLTVPKALTEASLHLVTSNHGANVGGEEYVRRNHFVYFDDKQVLTYKPGRPTCEPFRKYNTQSNGIYGPTPKTDAEWQSFSNWCPGDVIDTRVIKLGALAAGEHTFRIEVPDAQFVGKQGDFPLSLYVRGTY